MSRLSTWSFVVVSTAFIACGGAQTAPTASKPDGTKPDGTSEAKRNDPVKTEITPGSGNAAPPPTDPIYFDFDTSLIKDESKLTLQTIADYMERNPGATVTIGGHTDERGTTEYNLALGDQRAKASHDYLVRLGVDPSRIRTISYGEERPAKIGHDESTWSKNRRDEFETQKK
jgi:peptidoglycan-associated lipoprotein